MFDFDKVQEQVFEDLSRTFSISKTSSTKKTKLRYVKGTEQWRVVLEVPLLLKVREFVVFVELNDDFPLSLPTIYLSEEDYNSIKYIPHVDDHRNICLFDQENIKLDTDRPADIVRACLKRASKIISDGINGTNSGDFRDEIVAYWTNTYHANDRVFEAYLGEGVEFLSPGVHAGKMLSPSFAGIDFFLDSGTAESKKVSDYLEVRGHKVNEQSFYYLGSVETLIPPFHFSNRRLVDFLLSNFKKDLPQIKRYLNHDLGAKVFCMSLQVDKELLFFGFYIPDFPRDIKGWRKNSLNTFSILESVQPSKSVGRLSFKYFSQNRLKMRTAGTTRNQNPKKFLCAGLGSIGSNLLFYLSSLELSDVVLCDPDVLALENVNRHLLSYNDVGGFKVDALAKYLYSNNPFLDIKVHKASIVDLIRRDLLLVNSMDVIFCAIGKDSIESYILRCLADGLIIRPIMFFWVEPYLLGGHVLYIKPQTGFSLKNLEESGYYRYNIISSETYADPKYQLLLREAGCQGSYVPYGKTAITSFFAGIVPQLFTLLSVPPTTNIALSYAGDTSIAKANDISLSNYGKTFTSNQLRINTI